MESRRLFTQSVVIVMGMVSPCMAQVGQVSFAWEISTDGGSVWSSGLVEAPAGVGSVLVRARIRHSPDAGVFAAISLDPAIRSSPGDFADQILPGDVPIINGWLATASRVEPFLKIERGLGDAEFPGMGSAWCNVGNPWPSSTSLNPLNVLTFRLTLDDQPGDRHLSQVFNPGRGGPEGRILFDRQISPSVIIANYPTMTVSEATLRVVPGPGVAAIVGVGVGVMAARRRRG